MPTTYFVMVVLDFATVAGLDAIIYEYSHMPFIIVSIFFAFSLL